jgi:hypothetical protein
MIIRIEITDDQIEKAKDFAFRKQRSSYKRLGEKEKEEQYQHLFIGKLTELLGQEGLKIAKIPHFCPDKLKVVEEEYYKDVADCILFPDTNNQLAVDFKSAWQRFHRRILVPQDQYFNQKKDVYIGIRLHCVDAHPIPTFPNFKREADVYGWAKRVELHEPDESSSRVVPAYWAYLSELHQLDELLKHNNKI